MSSRAAWMLSIAGILIAITCIVYGVHELTTSVLPYDWSAVSNALPQHDTLVQVCNGSGTAHDCRWEWH